MNLPHNILVERLTKHTQALALPLGRRVGQPGHDEARKYLLKQMERIGLKPSRGDSYELTYELPHPNGGALTKFSNLVGVIPGHKERRPSADSPPIEMNAAMGSETDPYGGDSAPFSSDTGRGLGTWKGHHRPSPPRHPCPSSESFFHRLDSRVFDSPNTRQPMGKPFLPGLASQPYCHQGRPGKNLRTSIFQTRQKPRTRRSNPAILVSKNDILASTL